MEPEYIIGIDEAGRGPLAGRVFVGAVLFPYKPSKKIFKNAPDSKPNDSKKLAPKKREDWILWMKENGIIFSYSATSSRKIDICNINKATGMAARRAIRKIENNFGGNKIFTDKGMFLPDDVVSKFIHKKVLRADSVVSAVSLASIVAKVFRDKEMIKIAEKYPKYGFHEHKGYGTERHYRAIKKHGLCEIHRLTFVGGCNNISNVQ